MRLGASRAAGQEWRTMNDEHEHDAELLCALAEVRDVLVDEHRPEDDFYPAAREFLELLHARLVEDGLETPLDEWDPRPALVALEAQLAADRSLDVDLVAACKTVRDSLDAAARELAAL